MLPIEYCVYKTGATASKKFIVPFQCIWTIEHAWLYFGFTFFVHGNNPSDVLGSLYLLLSTVNMVYCHKHLKSKLLESKALKVSYHQCRECRFNQTFKKHLFSLLSGITSSVSENSLSKTKSNGIGNHGNGNGHQNPSQIKASPSFTFGCSSGLTKGICIPASNHNPPKGGHKTLGPVRGKMFPGMHCKWLLEK